MGTKDLYLSNDGLKKLKEEEGVIDGLYNDPSGYCTSGVGHLVHVKNKWKCFLLSDAQSSDEWKKLIQKKWPGKSHETAYLTRGTAFKDKFEEFKTKAVTTAKEEIANSKHKKKYSELAAKEKEEIDKLAKSAVDEEARILAITTDDLLKEDVKPFEKAVRGGVASVITLTQDEFDALTSFAFNVGVANFNSSTLLKEINKNKHRAGDASARRKAIDEIEKQFLKWNKSGGKVLPGLTKRRKNEAALFLKKAREELKELEKKSPIVSPKKK